MNKGLRIDKELTTKTKRLFGSSSYVVRYDLDPINHSSLNRLIVIDDVPGKVNQFFGSKTIRRYFVGRIEWHEILEDRKLKCPKQMEIELTRIADNLEKKHRKRLKAKRYKGTRRA